MERVIVKDFKFNIDKNSVLNSIQCYRDNRDFDKISIMYEFLKATAFDLVKPKAVFLISHNKNIFVSPHLTDCSHLIYVAYTIGSDISKQIYKFFKANDYLKAIFLDTMANKILFNMEDTLLNVIKQYCIERDLGINIRLEPSKELNLKTQKIILEELQANQLIGIDITQNYMLYPIKSNTFILGADKCYKHFDMNHSCNKCNMISCKMRDEN